MKKSKIKKCMQAHINKNHRETSKGELNIIETAVNTIKEASDHRDTRISCKECGKLYMGPNNVFEIMHHLMRCGTNATESREIMDAIVLENLRLGSWESDGSVGYSATEDILQQRISRFEMGPLNSTFIRKFFNIHINKHHGEDSKDPDLQADVLSENIHVVVTALDEVVDLDNVGELEHDNADTNVTDIPDNVS